MPSPLRFTGWKEQYRPDRVRDFGGVIDGVEPTKLAPGDSPQAINIDFDGNSIKTTRGMRKFGNQTAPSSAVRTRVDPALAKLPIEAGKSLPLRGYVYLPYIAPCDLGGDFVEE